MAEPLLGSLGHSGAGYFFIALSGTGFPSKIKEELFSEVLLLPEHLLWLIL
jgi:hypothetical protein